MRIVFISILIVLAGCSGPLKTYPENADLGLEPATLKGFATICYGSAVVHDFDDQYAGTSLSILPGSHHMQVSYQSRPYVSDTVPGRQFGNCVVNSEHTVEFTAQARKTYWFYVPEISETEHELSVWESVNPHDPRGRQVEATVKQISIKRNCVLDDRYRDCFLR